MNLRCLLRAAVSLSCCLLISGPSTARALILDSGDGSGNTSPPLDDPGWAYVGKRMGGPTVIYLGNDWVITAQHVGAGIVTFDGRHYDPIAGTPRRLRNPDGAPADLLLFKIVDGPELPPLPISRRSPMPGERVTMIGTGSSRGPSLTLRDPKGGLNDGFHWISESRKRWGTNRIGRRPIDVTHGKDRTKAIVTFFDRIEDRTGTRQEAHAALGDSGGALFIQADPFEPNQGWLLAGVMFTVSNFKGQPGQTSFYGDATYSADLSYYRTEMIRIMRPECSSGQRYDAGAISNQALDRSCLESAYTSGEPAESDEPSPAFGTGSLPASIWPLIVAFAGGLLIGAGAMRISQRRSAL